MLIEDLMIKELNMTIDLLESSVKLRRELTDKLLVILAERDDLIDNLHEKIRDLQRRLGNHVDPKNAKGVD